MARFQTRAETVFAWWRSEMVGVGIAALALGAWPVGVLGQSVVINEVFYHPASEDLREQYVELYNRGSQPVNLAGWRLTQGAQFVFPSLALPAGGFLVVAADLPTFHAKHPDVTAVVGNWVGTLSRRSERLELQDAQGHRVNGLTYADEGDWAARQRSQQWTGYYTWDWYAEHDGQGKSLELIDPDRSNECGQNWGASRVAGGTPGAPNSILSRGIAPLVREVRHRPAVPRSTDVVAVVARVEDADMAGLTVWLHYRVDGQPDFAAMAMRDEGKHEDGLANDGVFGALLPPQPHNTIVEFYVRAANAKGQERWWPADPIPAGTPRVNLLYQVDDAPYTGAQPLYRILMTAADRQYFFDLINTTLGRFSDARQPAAFVSVVDGVSEVRQLVGVRNRGQGSRFLSVPNFHINFRSDELWHDVDKITLNADYPYVELLGSALCQVAGFAVMESRAVQVRVNNQNLSTPGWHRYSIYVHDEVSDSDYARHHGMGAVNVYRCMRSSGTRPADLAYRGPNPEAYRGEYLKETNAAEDDYTDLIELTRVLDAGQTPDGIYGGEVKRVLAVPQWMRFFAINVLLENGESSLGNGDGDDYLLYPDLSTGQFKLVPRDLDTILSQGDTPGVVDKDLFVATRVPTINRLLKWPEFAPVYYQQLKELSDTVFAPEQFNPLVDRVLQEIVPPERLRGLKSFAAARRASVLSRIPLRLTVTHSLTNSRGYLQTTVPAVSLAGQANAIETRSVLVNGQPAVWSAWEARWQADAVPVRGGITQVLVQALDGEGKELERQTLEVWYDNGGGQTVGSDVTADTVWEASAGPYSVDAPRTVASGATLTIQPGTTVYLGGAGRLLVRGRLVAAGELGARIRFTRAPGATTSWPGLALVDSHADNRIAYADFEYGDGAGATLTVVDSRVQLDHVAWAGSRQPALEFVNSSLRVEGCVFGPTGASNTVEGNTIPSGGEVVFRGNSFASLNAAGYGLWLGQARRPGPIFQLEENLFQGSQCRALYLVEAEAHVEANRFVKVGGTPGATVGAEGGSAFAPHLVLARNVFSGLHRAVALRHGAVATSHNDTFTGVFGAAVHFAEQGLRPGEYSGATLVNALFDQVAAPFTGLENLPEPRNVSARWSLFSSTPPVAGDGNVQGDARLQVVEGRWRLGPGSAALGRGLNGMDIGADVPAGARLSQGPASPTPARRGTWNVWGPGIAAYEYRLDGAPYSAPQSVGTPITLTALGDGLHILEIRSQNSAGIWQEAGRAARLAWQVDPLASPLLINEVMASRGSAASPGDWVELVNRADSAVWLSGKGLTDDLGRPYRYVFPVGVSLGAGQYRVVKAAELGFGLRGAGETLYLVEAASAGGGLLDAVEFGSQVAGLSVGRLADGRWHLTEPTPEAENRLYPLGDDSQLRLNEWLAHGTTPAQSDFIELFNGDTLPVALDGVYLSDHLATVPRRQAFPPLTFIAARGFLTLFTDPNRAAGQNPLAFGLTADQGLLALSRGDGQVIDVVWYGPQVSGVSEGRNPDGASTIAALLVPGPGAPNGGTLWPVEVRLNEVVADNRSGPLGEGRYCDWVELYNRSLQPADLSDMSLSDQADLPRKFVFPPGTILPANGYLVIACDPDQPASATNTGFGLDAAGEAVYLCHSIQNGGGPADAIVFGFQAPDVALARAPAEPALWGPAKPTPGQANQLLEPGDRANLRINEWMARPAGGEDWFEVCNLGAQPVDMGGMLLSDNPGLATWHCVAEHSFIGTGCFRYRMLVADERPENGPTHVNFKLSASGETIALFDADGWLVDQIVFGPQLQGVSEGRLPDGSDTVVAFPRTASAGAMNYLDTDGDGMPDAWEAAQGFDPAVASDAALDPDHDGADNLAEFRAETNPHDPRSRLVIESISTADGTTQLRFVVQPGRGYVVETVAELGCAVWATVLELKPRALQERVEVTDRAGEAGPSKFYRVRVK